MVNIEKEDNGEIIFLVNLRNDSESIITIPTLEYYDMRVTIPFGKVS